MKRIVMMLVAACAVACGGSSGSTDGGTPPSNGVSGTVDGGTLNVKDAVFTIASNSSLGVPDGTAIVVLGDRTDLCAQFASPTPPTGNATVLLLYMVNVSLSGLTPVLSPLITGPYTFFDVNNPPSSLGTFWGGAFLTGPVCGAPAEYFATAGSALSLTQVGTVTGTHLKASFSSLTFGTSGTLTSGTIDAAYCAALNNPANECLGGGSPLRGVPLPTK